MENCLAQTHMDIVVEELVGDYDSPTLLVNSVDATGHPRAPEGHMSCRLDLPSEQILAALRGLPVSSCGDRLVIELQAAALQTLPHASKTRLRGPLCEYQFSHYFESHPWKCCKQATCGLILKA